MIQKQHKRQGRTAQSDDLPFQVGRSEAHVSHAAFQRDLGQDVVRQVAQHAAGVGQLARAEHVVDAEGLGRGGGRRSGVVRRVGELLLQLQVVQNQSVAVVGDAQAVRGLAVGGGCDPGGQPGARVGPLGQQHPVQRECGVDTVEVAAPVGRQLSAILIL